MKELTLKKLDFKSYILLSFIMGIALGLAGGTLFLLLSFISGDVFFDLGENRLNGIPAGIASFIAMPVFFSIAGAISGLIGFLPFKLLMKVQKELKLMAEYDIMS
jgi:hypothetical protein